MIFAMAASDQFLVNQLSNFHMKNFRTWHENYQIMVKFYSDIFGHKLSSTAYEILLKIIIKVMINVQDLSQFATII